jgi:hypothetical protein
LASSSLDSDMILHHTVIYISSAIVSAISLQ